MTFTDISPEEVAESRKPVPGPRILPRDIERAIVSEHYFTAFDGVLGAAYLEAMAAGRGIEEDADKPVDKALQFHTFCTLTLRGGYTVVGESVCVSPQNYTAASAKKLARANAISKVWPLLGFDLKQRLARGV